MDSDQCQIHVKVTPGARRNEIAGTFDDAVRVKLQAPPVEGKANAALLKFLAKRLGLRRSKVRIIAGETSRIKRIGITGLAADDVKRRLLETS